MLAALQQLELSPYSTFTDSIGIFLAACSETALTIEQEFVLLTSISSEIIIFFAETKMINCIFFPESLDFFRILPWSIL